MIEALAQMSEFCFALIASLQHACNAHLGINVRVQLLGTTPEGSLVHGKANTSQQCEE